MKLLDTAIGARSILSNKKTFNDPWIGHPMLNRLGLHPLRMIVSDAMFETRAARARRKPRKGDPVASKVAEELRRQGCSVTPGFLPQETFESILAECEARSVALHALHPIKPNMKPGTGHSLKFSGGVDRYDGGTTNRFITITDDMPGLTRFSKDRRFAEVRHTLTGIRRSLAFTIYENIHGEEQANHDVQKDLHRDTFHHTFKMWYYLKDVELEHGPFNYVMGSHRVNARRLRWEYEQSQRVASGNDYTKGGAFRALPADLEAMGLPPPTPMVVKANTLIVADTRGFHCRGYAAQGARRFGLYATFRPDAFLS